MKPRNRFNLRWMITWMVIGITIVSLFNHNNLLKIQPAVAQRISPGDVWQLVYQQIPDLPKVNQYISKETGKVEENNTLMRRLIRYHIYVKERSPIYRLDWKLTLADYLNANETIYENAYPSNDAVRGNPLEGDRAAINSLTRSQRNNLVQVLVSIFTPAQTDASFPTPATPVTKQDQPKHQPIYGGADFLK
jgi:hypothetical protein